MTSEEQQVEGVDVTDDGNPLTGVVISQSLPNWFRPVVIVGTVLTALLAMISLFLAVAFLAPSVSRLSAESEQGATERGRLLGDLTALRVDFVERFDTLVEEAQASQAITACYRLYFNDVVTADGQAQLALDEWAIATSGGSDNEAAEADAALADASKPLDDALRALEDYSTIDPPPGVCPHPAAD